jgi:hypothetical protein
VTASASAEYHLTKIREITGDTAAGNQSYIELQMYSSGQNFVSGHKITVWDADAFQAACGGPCPIQEHILSGGDPPNGDNQRTILIGDTAVAGADFTIPELSSYLDNTVGGNLTAAGAICFEAIPVDCVSGAASPAPPTCPTAHAERQHVPTGVLALRRNIGRTARPRSHAADDTNNAGADFALEGAGPTPNSAAPTEVPCVTPVAGTTPTSNLAAAIKKCKKKFPKGPKRKRCIRKAKRKAAA